MKILLVYPQTPVTFWSFHHALRLIHKKASEIPLGLITMASMLPSHWSLRLVDCNVQALKKGDLDWADMVFVGGMGIHRQSFEAIVRRANIQGKLVVAGGPLATLDRPSILGVDHWLLGEVEAIMSRFIWDLERGRAEAVYQAEDFPDLSLTPRPAWHLLDMKRYASMDIQISRGCPHGCEFCSIAALNGSRPRSKAVPQVLDELQSLYAAGWRGGVFIVDDNFIGNRTWVRDRLLPAMIEWGEKRGYPFVYATEATVSLAEDVLLMSRMVQAGFRSVFLGLETPHPQSLEGCQKRTNQRVDLGAAVVRIQAQGLLVNAGFIVGFDEDPPGIFALQQRFIQQNGIVTAMVGLLNAPKGSKLFDRLKREHRLVDRDGVDNTGGGMNFIPRMDYRKLVMGYSELVRGLYSPSRLLERIQSLLTVYRPPKTHAGTGERKTVATVVRAVWRLGVLDSGRGQFWTLVRWTLRTRPRLLALAVTLWAYGFHFRQVATSV